MNKPALKRFAMEAKRELNERVELQARKIGVTSEGIQKATIESSDSIFINGRQLNEKERTQRNKLVSRIQEIGFERVIEEVSYTWFNRFTALRFMEVNDYLPTKVRVLSSTNPDSTEPDMMKEALALDLELDRELIYELKLNNNDDELFKYLIIKHCNDLNRYMPFMFETIDHFTEILFPEGLLSAESFIRKMTNVEVIPESNWKEIEVIGWLYQYYIAEEKDRIFVNLKKNIKITKDTLPAATQLFTPNWIVRYMVENSIGQIWLESYPESKLKSRWKYYLSESEQEPNLIKQLEEIRYKNVNPEEITFLDPSCGSGHILVYAFDVFYNIYLEKGYVENEIPQLILEKNLFGLEVDDRAAQLASFAVMMKAREKSRRIFKNLISLNICAVQESNWLSEETITLISKEDVHLKDTILKLKNVYQDAKEYGSLLKVESYDLETVRNAITLYVKESSDLIEMIDKQIVEELFPKLLKQHEIMQGTYDVVCTNPPYMGRSNMSPKLQTYIDSYFEEARADLYSSFMMRGFEWTKTNGFNVMVTMQTWMFLPSFEKMRRIIIENKMISKLLYMDNMVMGIAFGTSATVLRNQKIKSYKGKYTQIKYKDLNQSQEPQEFPNYNNLTNSVSLESLDVIPERPIAYWMSNTALKHFREKNIGDYLTTREGMTTADNIKFLREWYEVNIDKIKFPSVERNKSTKWFPYQKGGPYRKWFGNHSLVVNWLNDGEEIKNNIDVKTKRVRSHNYNGEYSFKSGITFSTVTSGEFGARFSPSGFLFDATGSMGFSNNNNQLLFVLSLLNSVISKYYFLALAPTIHYKLNKIMAIPAILKRESEIIDITKECIEITKSDWNTFETAWDFKKHVFLRDKDNIERLSVVFEKWQEEREAIFKQLKSNEESLNKIFIEIYNLETELSPEVDEKSVSINKANKEREIKSFISYAIGCSFGRYSLDNEGVVYAGGIFNVNDYKAFAIHEDNIIPILTGAYFTDDIVTKFIEFLRISFGEENLEENLDFIANAIGRKKNETTRELLSRYFLNDYYKDHLQIYKKRPIYWLFTSGKEKAFNCLIYMHRYDKTTLSRIRTDYLHEVQIRMDAEKKDLLNIIEGDSSTKEISNAKKELKSLDKKIDELKAYDELLHHMADMQIEIDLDDGVAVNYAKFEGLVAKI